jgi:hypothetical protein
MARWQVKLEGRNEWCEQRKRQREEGDERGSVCHCAGEMAKARCVWGGESGSRKVRVRRFVPSCALRFLVIVCLLSKS